MSYKIAIIGPESSGKSRLTKELAQHFNEPLVHEFAREYLEKNGGLYKKEDLIFFAKKQIEKERELIDKANQFLFSDTNPLSIKVWSIYKYGSFSDRIKDLVNSSHYDLNLLLTPDLPYQEDSLREDGPLINRIELFHLFKRELTQKKSNYKIIGGLENSRLNNALKVIQNEFSL